MREKFENQLKIYCHARLGLEDAIEKIKIIINTLECTFETRNKEKIDEAIKRARDVLRDGLYAAEKTARDFNSLCLWALQNALPDNDYMGRLIWYQYYNRKDGTVDRRHPWHQHIDQSEGKDISKVIQKVTGLAAVLQSYGIETVVF